MITIREQTGYDINCMCTTLGVVAVLGKDKVVQGFFHEERVTAREMAISEELAKLAYKLRCQLAKEIEELGIDINDMGVPELDQDRMNRLIDMPYPFDVTEEEFVASYVRFDGWSN